MKIDDIAMMMGKTREEVEDMLKGEDVIELNLKERSQKNREDIGKVEVLN